MTVSKTFYFLVYKYMERLPAMALMKKCKVQLLLSELKCYLKNAGDIQLYFVLFF